LVIPGFGLPGILGLVSILASFVMLLMAGDWEDFNFENPFTASAITQVSLTFVLSFLVIGLFTLWLPRSKSTLLGGSFVLTEGLEEEAGYQSHEQAADELEGCIVEALTPLRPAGKARIDGKRHNVETEGDFVEAGETIRVLRREPGRIVVRRA
jgi:membrane-bound serine protease (ClpP class)